jgi:hypothetical protein
MQALGTRDFIPDLLPPGIVADPRTFLADQRLGNELAIDQVRHELLGLVDQDHDAPGGVCRNDIRQPGGGWLAV